MEWSVRYCLFQTQIALDQILRNFPNKYIGLILRGVVFPLGRRYRTPNDKLTQQCARLLMSPSDARDRLTSGCYVNTRPDDVTGSIEYALGCVIAAADAAKKLKETRLKLPYGYDYAQWMNELVSDDIITREEADLLEKANTASMTVINVDDFPNDFRQGASAENQDSLKKSA